MAQQSQSIQKACLMPKDGGSQINFMFNPTELQFSRNVHLETEKGTSTSKGLPKVSFAYVDPYILQLSGLVFDTYEDGTNVMDKIKPILASVDFSTIKRPPIYYFMWGEQNYIDCMVTALTYKLTMFLPSGRPVRAVVDITLQEVDVSGGSLVG